MPTPPKGPRFTVNVTADGMELSRRRDSSHCMVAAAIKDAMPKATSISVDLQTIRFSLPEKRLRYTYLTPRIAQLAIIKFDKGEMPDPFTFKLSGAHVTTMWRREVVATPHGPLTPQQQASVAKMREFNPAIRKSIPESKPRRRAVPDHPNLTKTQLIQRDHNGTVPERVGGPLLPRIPLARRRAFGLRALEP